MNLKKSEFLNAWMRSKTLLSSFAWSWVASQRHVFFFATEFVKSNFLPELPVVNDNEIVRCTSDGVEGKTGLIFLVRYI